MRARAQPAASGQASRLADNGCSYCVDMHAHEAREDGETEQRLYLVAAWKESPLFTARERAAFAWTEAVTQISQGGVSDELYALAQEQFLGGGTGEAVDGGGRHQHLEQAERIVSHDPPLAAGALRRGEYGMLKDRLRELLMDQARTASLVTYKELADRLGLTPPQTIHRVTQALEVLMAEDVVAGRPLLAALCVSRLQQRLPAHGFFATAEALGAYTGNPEGSEARRFHETEFQRALVCYGRS